MTYTKVNNLEDLQQYLQVFQSGFKFIAGGTDLMPNRKQGHHGDLSLLDVSAVKECRSLLCQGDTIQIGAMVTLDEFIHSPLAEKWPFMKEAALSIASPVIRQSATVGGNILCENRCIFYNQSAWWRGAIGHCLKTSGDVCIATGGNKGCFSKYVSDLSPLFLALRAELLWLRKGEWHRTKLSDLYSGDGVKPLLMEPNDFLMAITFSTEGLVNGVFHKLRQRKSLDFSSLSLCSTRWKDDRIHFALSGVDPAAVEFSGQSGQDRKEWVKQALKKSRMVDNDMMTRKYRRKMVEQFIEMQADELGL